MLYKHQDWTNDGAGDTEHDADAGSYPLVTVGSLV